jgi:Dam-replacing family
LKLGFEESAQAPYDSGSQTARILTEAWATKQAFCPNCGHVELSQFPNNRPVASAMQMNLFRDKASALCYVAAEFLSIARIKHKIIC